MPSIQESGLPLVFPCGNAGPRFAPPASAPGLFVLRTSARALEGMQKEAVVATGPDAAWRMVCDEGPYLNGSDLAPFPLAFFCTGLVTSLMAELLALMKSHALPTDGLNLIQDNRYGMEGSATAGTMTGSALPVELTLQAGGDPDPQLLRRLLFEAVAASPAAALLREAHLGRFSITHNGRPVLPARVPALALPGEREPGGFDALTPAARTFPADIIRKLKAADTGVDVPGGIGSSMQDQQKRILHMRGTCRERPDGLLETTVELFQPLGSRFQFLTESGNEAGSDRAPGSLAYLSAGLAFCYLTQLGRYTGILKSPLTSYSLVQDTGFRQDVAASGTMPVATHVHLRGSQDEAFARTVVDMGEQTCFLHAACRSAVKLKFKA